MNYLSGNIDCDLEILKYLSDKELLSQCSVNKYANKLCYSESFWVTRFINKYGKNKMIYKPENMTWRQFYLNIIVDSNLLKNKSNIDENLFEYIKIENLQKNFVVNHERWFNKKFKYKNEFRNFELFWTSPGNKSYYGGKLIKYFFHLKKDMKGIKLLKTADELEKYVEKYIGKIKDYKLPEIISDSKKNLWYAILEEDILGFPVDFINIFNEEIIFSQKNLKYLKVFEIMP
jgi:hypothetical protein